MNDFLGNIWLLVLRNRAFEGNPFEVVFAKPCLGGDLVCKDLSGDTCLQPACSCRPKSKRSSLISLQLALAPVVLLGVGIKLPHDMAVQRLHDADARHHRWSTARD
jgi:hypothetical protein